ncbi:fructose-6-phosphate aldolase [Mordavella massiliensis]|jgi:TalC/MipB family fructose-6-phosphate aldolase|uniref:Fructose-6-phosphate aldolase n=1 Tax=Mordavella massiliensis TaxID=1871024 RepID=A0A938XGT0_9CLOT|nr:fructose-6-phosphate aldolase [Mordavella massiliensis]MBM6826370.1 fructose-6-phosphate aldolase [Mordavella massiliensis]MBM6970368.1 fructose-6-phosphate aldolase [Mordavella massiliensis]
MKYLLDTANLDDIRRCCEIFPIAGVTSNPSIVKREGNVDFFAHMREIRSIIGMDSPLHIQVTAPDAEGMVRDADAIMEKVDSNVFVKVPVTLEGLKAMKAMKAKGIPITGTVVYSKQQGFLAMEAGADYIAPYFNRMENLGIDPDDVIASLAEMIALYGYPTQILAASFKNAGQVDRAFLAGAQTATMDPSILISAISQPHIDGAVEQFMNDWKAVHGETLLCQL